MGNSASSTGTVFVQTAKYNYYAGEMCTGSINVQAFNSFNCQGVWMTVMGEEKCNWQEQRTRTVGSGENARTESYTVYFNGQSTFFNTKVQVHNFFGTIMPGMYSFPFAFPIPQGLPGIFEASTGQYHASASIRYSIHGEVDVAGIFNADLRHNTGFSIDQVLNEVITQKAVSDLQNVNFCCCFKQGQASMSANVSKSCFAPGEVVQVILAVRNDSKRAFSALQCSLKRVLHLRENGGHRITISDIVSGPATTAGVAANTAQVDADARVVAFQLQQGISASVYGNLIQCEYFVSIKLVADDCCISNMEILVPVRIYAPQANTEAVLFSQAPPGWMPQTFPLYQYQMPQQAFQYGVQIQQPGMQ